MGSELHKLVISLTTRPTDTDYEPKTQTMTTRHRLNRLVVGSMWVTLIWCLNAESSLSWERKRNISKSKRFKLRTHPALTEIQLSLHTNMSPVYQDLINREVAWDSVY